MLYFTVSTFNLCINYLQKLCVVFIYMLVLILFCFAYQLNSDFNIFYCSQDGIIGTRDFSHMKNQEVNPIYQTMALNILGICQ